MTTTTRRQHRSCDQCRKGKRACDAEIKKLPPGKDVVATIDIASLDKCSNCKKWRRDCTFDWLLSVQMKKPVKRTKTKSTNHQDEARTVEPESIHPATSIPRKLSPTNIASAPYLSLSPLSDFRTLSDLPRRTRYLPTGTQDIDNVSWQAEPFLPIRIGGSYGSGILHDDLDDWLYDSSPGKIDALDWPWSPPVAQTVSVSSDENVSNSPGFKRCHSPDIDVQPDPFLVPQRHFVDEYIRSATARNLLRVYHDSIENALGCWVNERNCPYGNTAPSENGLLQKSASATLSNKEWGPMWSNRICARVCQLDRGYAAVRGRTLTSTEERAASKALHASIMAFSAQWAPENETRENVPGFDTASNPSNSSPRSHGSRTVGESMLDRLWNEAFHVLHDAAHIRSFRVIFAHMIFSLTQRPLPLRDGVPTLPGRTDQHQSSTLIELRELFDDESAPMFLDTAVRQIFSCRFQMSRLQLEKYTPQDQQDSRGPPESIPRHSNATTLPCNLLNSRDQETFNLLFWLAVMFDTLTAAMYQRPLVVSDEDSEFTVSSSQTPEDPDEIDLDGWNFGSNRGDKEANVWGNVLLHRFPPGDLASVKRWPCSFEDAAEILSDAAPIKVLLFRRVTRLQTLLYRGVGAQRLEDAIRDTLSVYQYWNRTYGPFISDCVAHHESLPPRIQSWYVLVAGHWHLAGIILADILETIDNTWRGLDSQHEARLEAKLVIGLKKENAVAISELARSSSGHGRSGSSSSFSKSREFHDALKEGAHLTEPWTAVLIRSFARAAYILLDLVVDDSDALAQCRICIDALWGLSRKSDMAYVAAKSLSGALANKSKRANSSR